MVRPYFSLFQESAVKALLQSKQEIAPGMYLLSLECETGINAQPGQFVILPVPLPSEKPLKGFYSLASAQVGRNFELLVERREGGGAVSEWVCERQVGESIEIEGPLGKAYLDNDRSRPRVFLASKAGMAPLRACVLALANEASGPEIWLFSAAESEKALLFDASWRELALKQPRFHYNPCPGKKLPELADPALRAGLESELHSAGFKQELHELRQILQEKGFTHLHLESFG